MLLVRGGRLHGWRFIGFGPKLDEASQVELAFTDSGIVGDAVRTVTLAQLENGSGAAPPFAKLPQSARAIAFPIAMSDQVVAVLYADDSAEPRHVAWATAIEVMGRHAARRLEALTAFSAARALTERGGRDAQPASIDPGGQSADEEHEAARRYARLLISEIKLYHEPAVAEGRRERDLATRLGGEIARARVLYDQRVPARLRGSTDYFQAELVRTLANGDASLLGRLKAGAP
jgi:hypothetical protein